jgi:hypothetical protein
MFMFYFSFFFAISFSEKETTAADLVDIEERPPLNPNMTCSASHPGLVSSVLHKTRFRFSKQKLKTSGSN